MRAIGALRTPAREPLCSAGPMAHKILVFFHLVGFAAYLGAGFSQQNFMKKSAQAGLAAAMRDEYERLAALVLTRIEVPAIGAQVVTGVVFIALSPSWLGMGWLHAKLACVVGLLGLSHAEMFNARKIVRARAEKGEAAGEEIAARKKRHRTLGTVGTLLFVCVLLAVAWGLG
jgi:protoporphyrinogen IX oxidase